MTRVRGGQTAGAGAGRNPGGALVWVLLLLAGACASRRPAAAPAGVVDPVTDTLAAQSAQALGEAVAQGAAETAADQVALDSLDDPAPEDTAPSLPLLPPDAPGALEVRGDEIEREAVELFGVEGRELIGEAPAVAFDIDVASFATNRRVLAYLRFFQVDSRDRFAIWLSRLGRYEGMIRERLRHKGLPEDLVYLTLIESGLSNTAVSRARAVGMWQFMASTGRMYGLTIDPWMDERRDPFRATDAAVGHLADLVERLGSVYLAAAAYNAGAGRVERGLRRLPGVVANGDDGVGDHVFFELSERRYLRRETRDYVPKLIAAALIAKQPGRYGFTDLTRLGPLVFDEVTVPDATGLDVLARLADTTVAALLELNPQFVRGVTPPERTVTVRVPRGRGTAVAERYADLPVTARVTFVDHYVRAGETLSQIARRYRVSQGMIQNANPRMRPERLRIGQRIIIPMSGRVVPPSAWSAPPEPRYRRVARTAADGTRVYRVRRGDTLSQIARSFRVSLPALLRENDLTLGSVIRPGDVLRIPGD